MLFTFLQVASLTLTLEAAVFLGLGNLTLTPEVIVQLTRMQWDFHEAMRVALARQCANTWAGILLLITAFGFQAWAIWRGPTLDELGAAHQCGLVTGILTALLIGTVAKWGAGIYAARSIKRATAIAEQAVRDSERPAR